MLQLDTLVRSPDKPCCALILLHCSPSVSTMLFTMDVPMQMDAWYRFPSEEGQQHTHQYSFNSIEWEQEPNDPLAHYRWELEVRDLCSRTFLWYEWSCQLLPCFPACFLCKRSARIQNRAQQHVDPAWQLMQTGQPQALSTSLTDTSIFQDDSTFNLSLLKASCTITSEIGRQVCDLG